MLKQKNWIVIAVLTGCFLFCVGSSHAAKLLANMMWPPANARWWEAAQQGNLNLTVSVGLLRMIVSMGTCNQMERAGF